MKILNPTQTIFSVLLIAFWSCNNLGSTNVENKESQSEDSMTVELVHDIQNALGEGSIWNHKTGELYWVDIEGHALFTWDTKAKEPTKFEVGQHIGTVVPAIDGNIIIALRTGIFRLNPKTRDMTKFSQPESDTAGIRMNDGKCDPGGRFWVGSMHFDQIKYAANLFRIDHDGTTTKMLDSITISNGINWSLDHKTMYYIDTPDGNVKAFDYDNSTGDISNGRVVVTIPDTMGFPDGMTIDAEGKLWIALWNGNSVTRWDPETGKLLQTIKVPAHNVTSCAFGDDDLSTLYITTARLDMTDEELEAMPYAGGVFKVKPGVKGVPAHFFGNPNPQ
ncbi:MAG: SMP-30/gluconolactonase/LRE family protein [Bacteroidota bacterium]